MKKSASEIKVTILGGGVIGLTTGIILKLHGFKVTVVNMHPYEDILYSENLEKRIPEFASIHAAASIIPHSVDHPDEREILAISQKFFHRLAFSAGFGVRVQRHYELREEPDDIPEYARTVKDFTLLQGDGSGWVTDHNIPRRKGAKGIWGWYFNAFFAEVPTYMEALKNLFSKSGGRIVERAIKDIGEIQQLNDDIIINCMGRWSTNFFPNDKEKTSIVRGHMIKVGIHEVPHDQRDQYFSYNYQPDLKTYSRVTGKDANGNDIHSKADVYFYPRSDGWLLGGSRQEGYPEINEKWRDKDEQISGKQFDNNGKWKIAVPEPIWTLNRELIMDITGIDIADPKYPSFSYVGYRFLRKPIRIENGDELGDGEKILVHNYGHGGAGYTLSWGCAYIVLKELEQALLKKQDIELDVEIDRTAGMADGYLASMKRVLTDLVIDEYIARKKNDFTPLKKID